MIRATNAHGVSSQRWPGSSAASWPTECAGASGTGNAFVDWRTEFHIELVTDGPSFRHHGFGQTARQRELAKIGQRGMSQGADFIADGRENISQGIKTDGAGALQAAASGSL